MTRLHINQYFICNKNKMNISYDLNYYDSNSFDLNSFDWIVGSKNYQISTNQLDKIPICLQDIFERLISKLQLNNNQIKYIILLNINNFSVLKFKKIYNLTLHTFSYFYIYNISNISEETIPFEHLSTQETSCISYKNNEFLYGKDSLIFCNGHILQKLLLKTYNTNTTILIIPFIL